MVKNITKKIKKDTLQYTISMGQLAKELGVSRFCLNWNLDKINYIKVPKKVFGGDFVYRVSAEELARLKQKQKKHKAMLGNTVNLSELTRELGCGPGSIMSQNVFKVARTAFSKDAWVIRVRREDVERLKKLIVVLVS